MNGMLILFSLTIPIIFVLGRYSAKYKFVRVRPRYRQDIRQFIRGRD